MYGEKLIEKERNTELVIEHNGGNGDLKWKRKIERETEYKGDRLSIREYVFKSGKEREKDGKSLW